MKKFRNAVLIFLFLAVPAALMTWSVLNDAKINCKVCMTYNGKVNCGNAVGNTKDNCVTTARDNACALIASGMTASIQCSQSTPVSVDVK